MTNNDFGNSRVRASTPWRPMSDDARQGQQIIVPSQWSGMDADIAQYDETKPNGHAWWSVKIEQPIDEPEWWMPISPLPR